MRNTLAGAGLAAAVATLVVALAIRPAGAAAPVEPAVDSAKPAEAIPDEAVFELREIDVLDPKADNEVRQLVYGQRGPCETAPPAATGQEQAN